MSDWEERLRDQIRKGYELGGGELCIIAARDMESVLAELERLREENKELRRRAKEYMPGDW